MYKDHWVIALIPARNEEATIGRVVDRCLQSVADVALVLDGGSTDATADVARAHGALVRSTPSRSGMGAALRWGLEFGRGGGYDVAVVLSEGGKDHAVQITRLLDPICDQQADLVTASRVAAAKDGAVLARGRRPATRVRSWLMSRVLGKPVTDVTSGQSAVRLAMLDDSRLRLGQRWLDGRGLEPYLLVRAIQLGYRHCEVPCTKAVSRSEEFVRMRPIAGWWNVVRPIVLLSLGIRE